MFDKKISVFLITLVFMLSISAVAAFEPTSVDDVETSDGEEEPPSGITLENDSIQSVGQDNFVLQTNDFSMYYRNGTRYETTLTFCNEPLSNASIIININGVNYTRITDEDGKASLAVNLDSGNHLVTAYYYYNDDNLISLTSNIEVLSSMTADDVVKIYKNDTQYYATLVDNVGMPLANSDVSFNINGVFYTRKTNENGVARLNINLSPGKYILTAIHPNGFMFSNNVVVLQSINGSDITKIYKNGTQYYARFLAGDGNPLVNTNVTYNINGVFYQRPTDENGISRLNINLDPGEYILTAINPVNGDMFSNTVTVLNSIYSANVISETNIVPFEATLLGSDGSLANNKDIEIYVDDVRYFVSTDENGVAHLDLDLSSGHHDVVIVDLENGLSAHNDIDVIHDENGIFKNSSNITDGSATAQYYSIYGVSPDGKSIMAIGRPSAKGELYTYGYKFYVTEFVRICPVCGSTELYWGIFWTGDETSNYGVFPATGRKEGGSAEGHIFCANCDADWSIFGNDHGSGPSLTILSNSKLSSKADAYALKNGEMIYNS